MRADRDEIELREGASFQAKIASVALITTAVVLLTACIAFVAQQYGAERRALADHNASLVTLMAPHVAREFAEGDPAEASMLVEALAGVSGVRAAFLIDAGGDVIVSHTAAALRP
jgi:hypothetical protein